MNNKQRLAHVSDGSFIAAATAPLPAGTKHTVAKATDGCFVGTVFWAQNGSYFDE